ncbi:MAG: right-handed parallel beta-helix repeat-containing protein, partial [Candidatus Hydrogenedentes bacterium]|nr:right-handed parallel beta-helix repeat-containing protein [Candidatus Hydrogenedentota bacterium]
EVTILYSDSWTLHLQHCDTVFIDGVTIRNNYFRTNSDGIDPNSCRNVHISNCHIVAGDDCIVLKATEDAPCENIVVTNCTLETIATALKLGTESVGDFRDIRFSNCVIRNSPVGIGFFMKDGGTMERVSFDNITIETANPEEIAYARNSVFPIFMDIEKRHADSPVGAIRDVTFSNLDIQTVGSSVIQGMPEGRIENLTLRDVTVRVNGEMDFSERKKKVGGKRTLSNQRDTAYVRKPAYFAIANVDGLNADNLNVFVGDEVHAAFARAALYCDNVSDGILRGVRLRPADNETPVVHLENARHIMVEEYPDPANTVTYLKVTGEGGDVSVLSPRGTK